MLPMPHCVVRVAILRQVSKMVLKRLELIRKKKLKQPKTKTSVATMQPMRIAHAGCAMLPCSWEP